MFLKKKKTPTSVSKKDEKTEEDVPKKQQKTPAEGSRLGAVILLVVSILISLGFYFWGRVSTESFMIDFGESGTTWEYSH